MNPCRAVPGLGIGVWGVPWPGWLEAGLWGSLWADLSLLFLLGGVCHPRKWSAAIKIVFVPLFELFCPFFVIFSSGSALAAWSPVSPDADFVASESQLFCPFFLAVLPGLVPLKTASKFG